MRVLDPKRHSDAHHPGTPTTLAPRRGVPAAFDEVLRGRRSIRRFSARDVPDTLVWEILDLARHAPSSMDGQPWCFVVVRDPGVRHRLAELKNAHCPPGKREAYPAGFVSSAPVVIAVCVERSRAHGRERENGILAAAYLLLAAEARELGSVFLTAYQPDDPGLAREIRGLLDLPSGIEPVALVPLGFPAEAPRSKELRRLEELVHEGTFGGSSAG